MIVAAGLATIVLLDPKYQNYDWGRVFFKEDVKRYSLSGNLIGKRCGFTFSTINPNGRPNYIKKIIPKTSPRRVSKGYKMSDIKKGVRVILKVGLDYCKDIHITARVLHQDTDAGCIILLDPKYQSIKWGYIAEEQDIKEYMLSPDIKGKRIGIVPPHMMNKDHCIQKILPQTSQRRL